MRRRSRHESLRHFSVSARCVALCCVLAQFLHAAAALRLCCPVKHVKGFDNLRADATSWTYACLTLSAALARSALALDR